MDIKKSRVQTQLTHLGRAPEKHHGMVNTPVYKTSTIIFSKAEEIIEKEQIHHTDKTYARTGTPTIHALQNAMSHLDGADNSVITSSGMHAISLAMLSQLNSGDHILLPESSYRCTLRFVEEELPRLGIEYTFYKPTITNELETLVQPNTKMLWMESPGSGTMDIQDIDALVSIAKNHNIITAVDSTWATPLFFRPIDLGIDIIVQSLTKYIGGHSDILLGSISANGQVFEKIYKCFLNCGTATSPDDCYLALRGLRSLDARLRQHEKNALKVAQWLETHPKVEKVLHPALSSHPSNNLWKKYFTGSSGLFSFVVQDCSTDNLYKALNSLSLFGLGLSWGGYESLAWHYEISGDRAKTYLQDNQRLIRIHVGLENPDDLIVDLANALNNI